MGCSGIGPVPEYERVGLPRKVSTPGTDELERAKSTRGSTSTGSATTAGGVVGTVVSADDGVDDGPDDGVDDGASVDAGAVVTWEP